MRMFIEPQPSNNSIPSEVKLVINISDSKPPELFWDVSCHLPDRHWLLGISQTVCFAVEEMDRDTVVLMKECSITLEHDEVSRPLYGGLIIVQGFDGKVLSLVIGDASDGRRLARQAVRWFTGGIRLDVP